MNTKLPTGRASRKRSTFILLLATAMLVIGALPALAADNTEPSSGPPAGAHATTITSGGPAGAPKVLILDTTVSGGLSSYEAQAAIGLGFGVDVADATSWGSLTTAQFSSYRAIVLGDAACGSDYTAALANVSTWAPAVNGSTIIIGTDPVFHSGTHPGAITLINKAMAFATGQAGLTGYYADLSCAHDTALPLVNAIEPGFTLIDGNPNAVHVVATNPYLSGLTDSDLTGWGNSVHEPFATWPSDFVPIAIATDAASKPYTAPDGTQGAPYILGRGAGLVAGAISLTATPDTLDVGATTTLTALVQPGGAPLAGATVTFSASAGPNAGKSGTAVTDASGTATFTYSSAVAGADTWTASFTPVGATAQTSNPVTVTWTAPAAAITIAPKFTG